MKRFWMHGVITAVMGLLSTGALAQPIDLVSVDPTWCINPPACAFGRVVIEVENLAYEKQVVVHHETPEGVWVDAPASYLHSVGDGQREIWVAFIRQPRESRFALRMTVGGVDYWNNNGGNDFRFEQRLAQRVNVKFDEWIASFASAGLRIKVRDLGAKKSVTIRLTRDGWRTFEDVSARRISTDGTIEEWTTDGTPGRNGASDVQFAVRYTVDGRDYWDSNGGANYRYSFYN